MKAIVIFTILLVLFGLVDHQATEEEKNTPFSREAWIKAILVMIGVFMIYYLELIK